MSKLRKKILDELIMDATIVYDVKESDRFPRKPQDKVNIDGCLMYTIKWDLMGFLWVSQHRIGCDL